MPQSSVLRVAFWLLSVTFKKLKWKIRKTIKAFLPLFEQLPYSGELKLGHLILPTVEFTPPTIKE